MNKFSYKTVCFILTLLFFTSYCKISDNTIHGHLSHEVSAHIIDDPRVEGFCTEKRIKNFPFANSDIADGSSEKKALGICSIEQMNNVGHII